ncbi:YHS domain-containing (seleno)protein [Flavobacterium faecale]|uniref:YHS domain-containing (seleno)protein n=1 Tax=Flavobacterium faecale TaxID=1355330 RepID=UPI003AAFA67B
MKNLFLLYSLILIGSFSFAQNESNRKATFNIEESVGIQGYDPVAYFVQSKAVKGKSEFSVNYEGVKYYFSSAENKEMFLKKPSKYEPAYGGWCAYAMGETGEKVSVNPKTFKIVNGNLYLFYNVFFNNTLKDWNKNETQLKFKADKNWKKIAQH